MPSIRELRAALGDFANDKSDEQLLGLAAEAAGVSPGRIASEYGYKPTSSGITGLRAGAALDRYQAGLYGLGEAVTGADWFRRQREANEFEAAVASERARAQGAIQSWEDVRGIGDVPSYLGELAIGSAPYMAEALTGGLAARGLMTGTRAALGAARTAGDVQAATAAARTLGTGQRAGAVAAAYPSSVGEILQGQREQAGETDLAAAAALGVPYAAVNAFGVEGALARQQLMRSGIRALDELGGIGGVAARTGATMARTGLVEGGTETLQEGLSQAGRMAVDPTAELFSPEAMARYRESAIGGALLGGVAGGVAGGWRRSEGYRGEETDLTSGKPAPEVPTQLPLGLTYSPLAGTPIIFPDGTVALGSEQELAKRYNLAQATAAEQDITAQEGAAPVRPGRLGVFDERDTALLNAGVKPTKRSRELYDTMVAAGVDMESDDAINVFASLSQNKFGDARRQIASIVVAKNAPATPVTPVAPVVPTTPTALVVSSGGAPAVSAPTAAGAVGVSLPVTATSPAPVVRPQPPAPLIDTSDEALETARATGNQALVGEIEALRGEAEGTRVDAEDLTGEQLNTIVQRRFAKSKNPQRDAQILSAYLTALRNAPKGSSVAVQEAIGRQFGIGAQAVRKIGNPSALVAAGKELGYSTEQVLNVLNVDDNTKAQFTRVGQLEAQIKDLRKQYAAATGEAKTAIANQMARANEEIQRAKDAAEQERRAAFSAGLQEAGVETAEGETAGFGFDTDREWAKLESSGEATTQIMQLADARDALNQALEEFQQVGNEAAVAEVAQRIADIDAQLEKVIADASKPKAKAAEKKPKKAKTVAAETAAEEKDAAKEAEAAKLRAERAAKLQADRNGLAVGDTVKNPKLGTGVVKSFAGDGDSTTVTVAFQSGQTKELSVKLAKLEKVDAVQVQSPAGVPVQPEARAGQEVGRQVRRAEEPAAEGQAQGQVAVRTTQEQYQALTAGFEAPAFDKLTDSQQKQIADLAGRDQLNLAALNRILSAPDSSAKFGKDGGVKNPYSRESLLKELKGFIRSDISKRKLLIVDSVADLLKSNDSALRALGAALQLEGAYGVAQGGRAVLVANRISQGSGRAKFMHEVGAHLGLENLLPKVLYDRLTQQLVNWAKKDDGSVEADLAARAAERVMMAGTTKEDQRAELLAYFLEEALEAGIDPTADIKGSSQLKTWFRTLWAAFKVAVRKLGMNPDKMEAVDVVNMAFGAARLEISGTFHGTAAAFRNFRNKYIGTGEGATAYGWGTYLAQRAGIAKGYWQADVSRKTMPTFGGIPIKQAYRDAKASFENAAFDDPAEATAKYDALRAVMKALDSDRGRTDPLFFARGELEARAKDQDPNGYDARALKWFDENVEKFSDAAPEGALMRVDTAINDEAMYDYDKRLGKQSPVVQDALYEVLEPLSDEIVDRTNTDIPDLTGQDLFGTGENDLGLISRLIMDDALSPAKPDAQFDRAVQQGKFHEAASHYLRTLGLDGIKFFDAKSRGTATDAVSFNGRLWNRDDLRNAARDARNLDAPENVRIAFGVLRDVLRNGFADTRKALEDKVAEYEQMNFATAMQSAARFNVKFDPEQARAEAKEFVQRNVFQAKQLAWLNANEKDISITKLPKTQNLVIFDDKNIFRVGAQVAASRQRMKFGKAAPAARQGLIDRNINKLPQQLRQPANNIVGALGDLMGRGLDYVVFTSDLVGRAVQAGMPAAQRFATALANSKSAASERERRVEKIADMYATIEEANKGSGPGSANEFLFESTRTGKWGYGKYRDAKMGAMFDALGPKAQAFVKAVFQHGDTMLSEKKTIVLDAANSEYDAMIAIAKRDGDKGAEAKLKAEKVATLKRFDTLFKIREGLPYAPIKRSGSWAVVSRSPEYQEALSAGDSKRVRELEQNPDHYQVSFVDSKWEARTLQAKIDQEFAGLSTSIVKRAEAMDDFSGKALLPALTSLRAKVDAERGTANTKVHNIISQLYLEALAEDSARKSEMRRRGISGEVDMLASFTTQGRADANFLAAVQYSPEIQDALQQMRSQSKTGDVTRKTELFDEISSRYTQSLDYNVNPWVDKLTGLSSKYFLATSPGYYIQNLTQPFMMSVPAMAGRHDYAKVGQAMWKAYSELGPLFKNTKLFDQQFDFTQVPADVRAAVDELVKRGKIDIGLATEINEFKVDADNKLSQFAQRLNKGMRMAVQKAEAINRLSTAMAAYRLELERAKKDPKVADPEAAAIAYADRILTETHGDYTAFNAPRIFNSNFGKIALQFRKFQLIQIGFYAKLLRDAFTNPAERAAAMRTLGYSLAHSGVFAGVLGLPGYAAVAALAGFLFGDEDEPYDLTEEMRKALGPEWSQLIMRGVPTLAGVDLSGKIGSGQMLSIAPFADIDLTTQAGVTQAIGTIAGGAAGGMAARMLDGLGLMMNGDIYRGTEQVMPKGIGDMLKAGRIAGEGLTRRNGDVILGPDDVSQVGQLFAAIGLPSAKVAETYQARQSALDLEKNFTERATKVKNQYARAFREKDAEGMAEARDAWMKLQAARRRNDLKPQPMSSLLRAPQEQRKREQKIAEQID